MTTPGTPSSNDGSSSRCRLLVNGGEPTRERYRYSVGWPAQPVTSAKKQSPMACRDAASLTCSSGRAMLSVADASRRRADHALNKTMSSSRRLYRGRGSSCRYQRRLSSKQSTAVGAIAVAAVGELLLVVVAFVAQTSSLERAFS